MADWQKVGSLEDCPSGSAREFVIAGRLIAVFHLEDTLYALDGVCPHQGGPLAEGTVTGTVVTCPWHGWQFDLRDGQHQFSPSTCQPTFPVKVEDGKIFVDITTPPDAP